MSRVAAPSPRRCSRGEHGQRLRAEQRRVGEDDEDVVLTVEVVGEGGEAHGDGVAGAALHRLLDEFDRHVGEELLLDRLGDVFGAVPDDDDDAIERERGEGVEHVQDHGAAAQRVQHLGRARPHARALAGRGHDGSEWTSTLTGHLALASSLASGFARVAGLTVASVPLVRRARWRWLGGEVSNLDLGLQRTPCCRYTTPERRRDPTLGRAAFRTRLCRSADRAASVLAAMGSLIKKRRKRMRKKKHKKLLKRTRWQRRQQGR